MDQSLQYPIRLYKNLEDKREGQIKKGFNTRTASLGLDKTLENRTFKKIDRQQKAQVTTRCFNPL